MNKLKQLKQWAEELYLLSGGQENPFSIDAFRAKVAELQSQAPDNLEGYLEGKDITKTGQYVEAGEYVNYDDAIAALQQLAEDKDAEKNTEIAKARKSVDAAWSLTKCANAQIEQLQAENERLKGLLTDGISHEDYSKGGS